VVRAAVAGPAAAPTAQPTAQRPTLPTSQPVAGSAPAAAAVAQQKPAVALAVAKAAVSGAAVPPGPPPPLQGNQVTADAARPGTQMATQTAASQPEAGAVTGRRVKLKVRKTASTGVARAAGNAQGSGPGKADSVGGTVPPQPPASQLSSAPPRPQLMRPVAKAAHPAHPPPQHAPQRPPPRPQQHVPEQATPFAEGTYGHFLHLQQLAASRQRAGVLQQQQQQHLQPQMRPPWLPPPAAMFPPANPFPGTPAHLHMPRPGMPGFAAAPLEPGFGPPQGWPGHVGAPPQWPGAYLQDRSSQGGGPPQKGGPGDHNGKPQPR